MKKCFKCQQVKPISEFYKHKMMADGHLNKCKDCACKDIREHRIISERPREYDMERYYLDPNRKVLSTNFTKQWRIDNPAAYVAHGKVAYAVKMKRLIKQPCSVCGMWPVHAHHDDYSKPLEVMWLCALHHHRNQSPYEFKE